MLLAASLPLSKYTMSITEICLLALWLWSGFSYTVSYRFFKLGGFFKGVIHFTVYIAELAYSNFTTNFRNLFRNRPVMVFLSIYLIHIIGLTATSDITYALKDLRIKLPLLLLPVVISTMEKQGSRKTRSILLVYIASVFVSTLFSAHLYFTNQYVDIREISSFISPIRLGLNVCFSIAIIIYFVFHDMKFVTWQKISFLFLVLWFITFLFILEAVTSIFITLVIIIGYLLWRIFNTMVAWQRVVLISLVVLIPLVFVLQIRKMVVDATTAPEINIEKIDRFTDKGNAYDLDFTDTRIEDGKYVNLYICYKELKQEWNKRSDIDYNGFTKEGQLLNETLIRYMTSKDLRKDANGVSELSDEDIRMIENGMANYNYIHTPGLKTRILKIIKGYEVYKLTGNPSGSSVMQRVEYLRASFSIIGKHYLIGVGTGDLEDAFNAQFLSMNSSLEDQYRYHAHNQFLGIFVALGVIGFIVFVIALFYTPIVLHGFKDYYFRLFFIIMFISMFSDDTLETQAGVTLFAFFYSFLLFGRKVGDKMPAGIDK